MWICQSWRDRPGPRSHRIGWGRLGSEAKAGGKRRRRRRKAEMVRRHGLGGGRENGAMGGLGRNAAGVALMWALGKVRRRHTWRYEAGGDARPRQRMFSRREECEMWSCPKRQITTSRDLIPSSSNTKGNYFLRIIITGSKSAQMA